MNKLQEKYADDIQKHLAKYPPDQKRSAVMPLLYIAQRDDGYVSKHDIEDIAEIFLGNTRPIIDKTYFYAAAVALLAGFEGVLVAGGYFKSSHAFLFRTGYRVGRIDD